MGDTGVPSANRLGYRAASASPGELDPQVVREGRLGRADSAAPARPAPEKAESLPSLPRPPHSPAYLAGLMMTTAVVLLLPVVYLAFVWMLSWLLIWHVQQHVHWPMVVYVPPIVLGVFGLFFLIKPFLAPHAALSAPISLRRSEQPQLFRFVEQLARAVHAPPPKRIDVDTRINASASFLNGWRSVFGRGELVLTIGLPLLRGLSRSQLTGVLAHEFGHFSQGIAMRLTFLVSSITAWFSRAVDERDDWDRLLEAARTETRQSWLGRTGLPRLFFAAIDAYLAVTRAILWALMVVAQMVSSYLLRQMEFEADRVAARVIGSEPFAQTGYRIAVLAEAGEIVAEVLNHSWQERRLPDDLVALVQCHLDDLEQQSEQVDAIHARMEAARTSRWDTHPAMRERVRELRLHPVDGVYRDDTSAFSLLQEPESLCRQASLAFYEEVLGTEPDPGQTHEVVSARTVFADFQGMSDAYQSIQEMSGGLFGQVSFFPGPWPTEWESADAATASLRAARAEMASLQADAQRTAQRQTRMIRKLLDLRAAQTLLEAGYLIRPSEFGLADTGLTLTETEEQLVAGSAACQTQLAAYLTAWERRLTAAATLVGRSAVSRASVPAARYLQAAWNALHLFASAQRDARQLSHLMHRLAVLARQEPLPDYARARSQVEADLARQVAHLLDKLYHDYQNVAYPLAHGRGALSLAEHLLPGYTAATRGESPEQLLPWVQQANRRVYELTIRLLGTLTLTTQQVESALGMVEPT